MEGWVTAPSMEIADDLTDSAWASTSAGRRSAARPTTPTSSTGSSSTRTSRSSPMPTATTSASRSGLADYNFIWHVGDRLTLLSDGIFDFFGQGQKIVTVGMFLTRPPRGSLYVGFRVLEGPISSEVLAMSYSYLDEPEVGVIVRHVDRLRRQQRQSRPELHVMRVGESLLVSVGLHGRSRPKERVGQRGRRAAVPAEKPPRQRRRPRRSPPPCALGLE